MKLKEFYKTSTNKIDVSVTPKFLSTINNGDQQLFNWRYFVKIKNNGSQTVQIIKRYWKIIHEDGFVQEISGDGLVGKKPVLVPQLEFEYNSNVQLPCKSGIMGGYYYAKKDNGEILQIEIPKFSLDIPNSTIILN